MSSSSFIHTVRFSWTLGLPSGSTGAIVARPAPVKGVFILLTDPCTRCKKQLSRFVRHNPVNPAPSHCSVFELGSQLNGARASQSISTHALYVCASVPVCEGITSSVLSMLGQFCSIAIGAGPTLARHLVFTMGSKLCMIALWLMLFACVTCVLYFTRWFPRRSLTYWFLKWFKMIDF